MISIKKEPLIHFLTCQPPLGGGESSQGNRGVGSMKRGVEIESFPVAECEAICHHALQATQDQTGGLFLLRINLDAHQLFVGLSHVPSPFAKDHLKQPPRVTDNMP